MNELTLQQLKDMEPGKIFASGVIVDGSRGINMANTGKMIDWIACRGGIEDWCIYCHFADESWGQEQIHDNGDKVTFESNIKKLVPCDDEAFAMYRY